MEAKYRRALACALAALLAFVAACAGGNTGKAHAIDKVTFITGFGLKAQDAAALIGQEMGFFHDEGLDVEILPGAGTGPNLKLLAGGKAQFVVVDLTGAILQYYGNTPFRNWRVVGAIYQKPVSCIIVRASSGIKTPRDLEGKTIAYAQGGVNKALFPVYAKAVGIDAAKVKWRQMDGKLFVSSLTSGQVDAITEVVTSGPFVEKSVGTTTMFPYSERLGDEIANAIAVSTETAEHKPDLVRRFNTAIFKSLKYVFDNPDAAAQVVAKRVQGYTPDTAKAEIELVRGYVSPPGGGPLGHLDDAQVARNIVALNAAGTAVPSGTPDPKLFVDFDLVPKS
jgi:NitT/TauT family transport system substrate-binding protein